MSDIYFKASLQNTLSPAVGTFDNVGNKKGKFTLEDGEYYLTNDTGTSYRTYYPTKDMYPVGFTTVEFDINYSRSYSLLNSWCLLFNGNDESYHGFGVSGSTLQFVGDHFNYSIVTSPSTWLHVKCIFDYNPDQNIVHIYIDNVEVNTFTISNKYYIKTIDILGNYVGYVADAKIKNITICNSKKHYLDTIGFTSLWSKIKSLFATKTELASKANTSDLSNYYTKPEVDNLLSQDILKGWPDGPEAHNAMWGGRDITAAFNSGEFSKNVADGTFKDIFPGDYIRKSVTISGTTSTINWVITDCDYWINKGDTPLTAHHVAIVPQEHPLQSSFEAQMNSTNTTEGGYAGSKMYINVIPTFATGIVNAFGSDHILTFRDYLTQDLNTSAVSSGITVFTGAPNWNGAWYSQQCNLMSEAMVYDGPHCASSALDNMMATRQMSAFRLSEKLITYGGQRWWWLRDVVSSTDFAEVDGCGCAFTHVAGYMGSVRPFALLR